MGDTKMTNCLATTNVRLGGKPETGILLFGCNIKTFAVILLLCAQVYLCVDMQRCCT